MSSRHARRGPLHYLWVGINVGILALVVALAALLVVVPRISGAVPLTVLTSSMTPSLPAGCLIVVKPTPIADIRVGSVLTYHITEGQPQLISHRVVEIDSRSDDSKTFITKGDNNPSSDPKPVTEGQVVGTVWYTVPLLGYVNTAIGHLGNGAVIGIVALLLIGYGFVMVVRELLRRSRRRKADGRSPVTGAAPKS